MLTRRRPTSAKGLQAAQTSLPHTVRNPSWISSVGASYWRILARKTLISPRGFSPSPPRIGEAAARTLASTTTGTFSRIEGNSPRRHRASICGSGSQRHPPRPRARGTGTPATPEMPHITRPIGTHIHDPASELPRIPLPRTPVNTSRGRQVFLWQRLDAVAGSDHAAREYVGSQPAPVYEATQHSGPR